MKVSIIIPIYNVAPYIERCLHSVVSQCYNDIEVLLVDDCGTDNSMEIVQQFVDEYCGEKEFRIIHHEKNKGLSAARNTGTIAANGDFLFYIDSDDEITPDCIELMMNEVLKHPDVEMVQGTTTSIPDKDYYHTEVFNELGYVESNDDVRRLFYKTGKCLPCNAWNKLISIAFIRKYHLFFKEGLIHEDQHWMFFVCKYLKNYSYISNSTYIHYSTPNSIMTSGGYYDSRSNCHWSVILNDIFHNIDEPCAKQQIAKYYINYYDKRIGMEAFDNSAYRNTLFFVFLKYFSLRIGVLFVLTLLFSSKQNMFNKYEKKLLSHLLCVK